MSSMKIVTDSTADIDPGVVEDLGIEVVPILIHANDRIYRMGVDISTEQFYELLQNGTCQFRTSAPSPLVFEHLYRRLALECDYIFSVHASAHFGDIMASAAQARSKLPASTNRLELIDSKSTSMGMGLVVLTAAQAIKDGATPDEVFQLINGMIRHTHIAFFVDTMDYLERSGRLSIASSVLGSMQRIKPLMILDEGEIVPYERTRTRAKAIEGLYTFIEDFPHVQNVTILYSTTPEDVEKLQEKIEPIFPREQIQVAQFGPGTAIHLGPGSMGVVVFEGLEA